MKRLATLLIAAAASAHAQFAVMHTNGVVTSPNNLTIQQSNVAGLASALDSKLGTNPTLAISNTAGLQSALDGKLATNGTLAVSNVSGLQSALDGKLATNGSASGLSGFVGTTNAETARGNLGISNTFAGQFHADFYDDFSRYTNGTQIGAGAMPMFGNAYGLRLGSTNYSNPPTVIDGKLVSTNGEVFYLTSELDRNVYNFGAVFEFDQNNGGNSVTILVQPDDFWIGRVLHIAVSPFVLGVDVSTNGTAGFGGTNTIISHNFGGGGVAATNSRQLLLGQIIGDTLKITYGGQTFEGRHAQLTNVVGPYFSFESFYTTNTLTNHIHEVWANSEAMNRVWSQPYSDTLADASRGYGRFSGNLAVGDNVGTLASNIGTNKAIFGGDIVVQGAVRGWAGSNSAVRIGAPMVYEKSYAAANTNTTNLVAFSTFGIGVNTLTNDGSRWKGSYIGSFAANTNNKRVVVDMAGTRLDTGDITDQGQWTVDVTVYRSTNNSHEAFAMFQSEQTTKMSRWTFNNGAGVQFNVQLQAAATSNNEVTLRGAWADFYP